MALLQKALGRRRDLPQLESVSAAAAALGAGGDYEIVITTIPNLTKATAPFWPAPSMFNQGGVPPNRMSPRVVSFISQAAANTAGVVTNTYDWKLNVWRGGVLQGALAYYTFNLATTIGTAVGAGNLNANFTVTPAAMTNIVVGQDLGVGAGGSFEVVRVLAVTATTFTAVFTKTHAGGDAVTAIAVPFMPIGFVGAHAANTTVASATAAATTITPASMYGIHVGDTLLFDTVASGKQESVKVLTVTDTTFTCAAIAQTHSAAPLVSSALANGDPFELQEGDVLTLKRLTLGTGAASPAGLLNVEWVPAKVLG